MQHGLRRPLALLILIEYLRRTSSFVPLPEVAKELPGFERQYPIKVVGVTFANPDGDSRQSIIKKCAPGDDVELRPEPHNKFDKTAIAVVTASGKTLGYLPRDSWVVRATYDENQPTKAYIRSIRRTDGCYGCVLMVGLGDILPVPTTSAIQRKPRVRKPKITAAQV